MNNPYEDLEYLSEFLPEEGESVIVSRRRGQLVCESYFEPQQHFQQQTGLIDRELYGRLATVDTRLRLLWRTPVIAAVFLFYVSSLILHGLLGHGWAAWYLDVGLALGLAVACFQAVQWLRRRYFRQVICPVLQKWMLDHQLDKYTLIAWLTTHRNLGHLRNALTRWT